MPEFVVAEPCIVILETAFHGHIDNMGEVKWKVIYDLFNFPWKEHAHDDVPYQTELLYDNCLL